LRVYCKERRVGVGSVSCIVGGAAIGQGPNFERVRTDEVSCGNVRSILQPWECYEVEESFEKCQTTA
jgi:hypothetical protein